MSFISNLNNTLEPWVDLDSINNTWVQFIRLLVDLFFFRTCWGDLGKIYSYVDRPPSAVTRWTLGGYLHCIWDTQESLVFHFNYTCYSLVPLSFTRLSFVGHLVSKVSSEYFITDLSGLGGKLIQSSQ